MKKGNPNHYKSHGESKTRLYRLWHLMKSRINCSKRHNYHRYGGRGITYCEEWEKYENFRSWALSNGYKDDLTLDRIETDGNYEPSNCKFSTRKEQQNNLSFNTIVTHNGKTQTLSQWSDEILIPLQTLHWRLHKGWETERAFSTPLNTKFINKRFLNG